MIGGGIFNMIMKEKLDQLISCLLRHDAYVLEILLPGLSAEKVRGQIENAGISLPVSVCNLYQWRNGIANIYEHNLNSQPFFSFGIFYSL